MTRKYRGISILVLVAMIISLLPVNTLNVSANSDVNNSTEVPIENTEYLELHNQLTTYINDKVAGDTSEAALNNHLEDADFEKAIAQREFISKAGALTIGEYVDTEEKKNFIDWILNNTEAMNLFLENGEPVSTYPKAFDVWFEIFTKDPDSHTGYELRLAIGAALRLGNGVPKWYTSRVLATPYERYEYYKVREAEGVFPISMKTRSVWDIRNILSAPCSNWDLDYVREMHKDRWNERRQMLRIKYPPYRIGKWEEDFTIKEVHEEGGFCGTWSKFGTITYNAFGVPGFNCGQPGHAAHVFHSPSYAEKWAIGNNLSTWGKTRNQQNLIPYTNYNDVSNRTSYLFVYEKARKDEEALHRSFQLKWIADALTDYNKAQAVRKVAMKTNKWNIDVWKDYIYAIKNIWNNALEDIRVPSDKMTASATNIHNSAHSASKVLDGDTGSIWHTNYGKNKAELPQSITLAFDKEYYVGKFVYVPRQKGINGTITKYNLYASVDGEEFELISHGNWADNQTTKTVEFEGRNAKYIKLEALEGHGGYATASELRVYEPFDNKPFTIEERYELANSIIDNLREQPRAAYDLSRIIKDLVLTEELPREKQHKYMAKLELMLSDAFEINIDQRFIAYEIWKSLPSNGYTLADFNFNGDEAGRLVGSKTDMEYSLDGGLSWKPITEDNMKLSDEEIESITAEYNIKLRLKGTNEDISLLIMKAPSLPKIYANDDMNKIFGLNNAVHYSIDNGETWTRYTNQDNLPDLTGDVEFTVMIPAQGKTMGSEIRTYTFSSKVNPLIILPSDMESVKVDTIKSTDITSAYDGNINSYFHTSYSENGGKMPQSVTIELKETSDIYKLEYVPRQDGRTQGCITEYNIYASGDGENFELVSKGNWLRNKDIKTAIFNAKNAKYIKLEGVEAHDNYIAVGEIRLYKSDTSLPHVVFSFDGLDAERLVGANTDIEYSLDNGETWKPVTEVNMTLPSEDMKSIYLGNNLKVRFKNSTESNDISFGPCEKLPDVVGDDIENTITGLDETMEYSYDGGETWITYDEKFNVGLRGNVELRVRYKATGTTFASDYITVDYTAEETPITDERVTYKIISSVTGRCLDVTYGVKTDNASLQQYNFRGTSNQTANIVNISGNQYKIVMRHSGKVLAPKDLSTDDGAELVQTTYTGNDIEKWEIVNLGNNEYEIINVATGLALTANSNKSDINISKLVHNKNQVWTINYVSDLAAPEVTFSFDGDNPGKIMGSNSSMEYTIDGGQSWKPVTRDDMALTQEEIIEINSKYGIRIRVKGNAGITVIDTVDKPGVPNVEVNDTKNIVEGIDSSMEYSMDFGSTWVRYKENDPVKFLSDVDVLVRIAGKGVTSPGESKKLRFTSKITTSLYKEFDPMKYVTVKDFEGNDISDNIEVTQNNVDINKKGLYSVTYKISDGDNEKSITKEVEVVSDFKYLSDIKYKSSKFNWERITKDVNTQNDPIVLNSIYGKDTFEKGILAHASSEIVYDVENMGYTNFESYIGIDNYVYDRNSSVIFKIYVDGTLKYDSGVIGSKDPCKFVDVDIEGAKEVKLVADSNGSSKYDHATWADAKFVSKDSATVIEATNVAYEKDDEIDFDEILQDVKAFDVEDGDISSLVTYTTNYVKGKTGNFDIVYSVIDSDGYKTQKNVKLIVVNSSIYVSDTNWVSTRSGWSSTKKDMTTDSKRLALWDGEKSVTYEKGIGSNAYSETIYDIEGKDYGYFTSFVGAARAGRYRASVQFRVYVDDELAAETGVMRVDTPQEFIKVNIAGAKTLKLVIADGGNGNKNDNAIWADAKFLVAEDDIVVSVDTSKLDETIEQAEDLIEEEYGKDSWENLQEKLDAAKALLNDEELSQTSVDEALEELLTTISNLEKIKNESPVINASDITVYQGSEIDFDDILSKVTATDEEDGDLSSEITYTTDYVQDELGEFEIVYSVTDSNGNETTKRVKLNVLEVKEKFVYASDLDWVKATTQYKRVLKNKSIKGKTLRLWDGAKEVTFNKGIGTHANSEIIYDLTNKGFKYFTSYIGVNRTSDHRGSVVFKVFVDDELEYTSEIMKRDTPLEYVKVNVEGADNIKLVVENGGNGNASDHSNWADTKFLFEDDNFVPIDTFGEKAINEQETVKEEEVVNEQETVKEEEVVNEQETVNEVEIVNKEEVTNEEEVNEEVVSKEEIPEE